jgi:hypothetical protein
MPGYKLSLDDVIHKSQLHHVLIEFVNNLVLAQFLVFKVRICPAMSGYLECVSLVRSNYDPGK